MIRHANHDFNPLVQMASGVYLTFFGSLVFGTPAFPLSDVPLQAIATDIAAGRYKANSSWVFRFELWHVLPCSVGWQSDRCSPRNRSPIVDGRNNDRKLNAKTSEKTT